MPITPFTEERPILGASNAVVNTTMQADNGARYANAPLINIRRGGQPTENMEILNFGQGVHVFETVTFSDAEGTYSPADRVGE